MASAARLEEWFGADVLVGEEEEDDEEEEEVEFGFTFVTWPLTIQLPVPCSQHCVALSEAPLQHQDWSGHW